MKENLRLGRIAGIPIGINWSVVVIVSLVTQSLAVGVLPESVPGYSSGQYWAVAGGISALFFLSLLAHETAHALVAQRYGVRIERITLWMLGGVAVLDGEPATPKADLRVAAAGPLTSFAAGAGFLATAAVSSGLQGPVLITSGLGWLGGINLLLAVFNLVPAAPLDGGRVLRAYLWSRGRSRSDAAVAATRAGRVVGLAMLAGGSIELLLVDAVSGLWLMLLGSFVLAAAGQEQQSTLLKDRLGGLRIRDVMTPDPVCGPDYYTVEMFSDRVALQHRHSAYPLVGFNGEVTGLVTLRQLAAVSPAARSTAKVAAISTPRAELTQAGPDDLVFDVLSVPRSPFSESRILVFEDDTLVGLVTSSDVARIVQQATLRPVPVSVPAQAQAAVQASAPTDGRS